MSILIYLCNINHPEKKTCFEFHNIISIRLRYDCLKVAIYLRIFDVYGLTCVFALLECCSNFEENISMVWSIAK